MSNYFDSRANLQGKVAAVIGGGEGMGRAIVLALLENGVDVYMGDYNDDAMAITVEEAKKFTAKLVSKHVDVCSREQVKAYWDEFDSHFDHLEILMNVAGGTWHQEFLNTTPDFWDNQLRRNLMYCIESTYEAGKRMKAGGKGGSIINLTTIEAYRAAPGFSVYVAAKAGLVGWTRTMSVEFAPYNIRLNCIAPDQTLTPGGGASTDVYYDPAPSGYVTDPSSPEFEKYMGLIYEQAKCAIPMGRPGYVEDIVKAALFYASDLSSYITGGTLHVDGGAAASSGWYMFPEEGFRNRIPAKIVDTFKDIGEWPTESTGNKSYKG